MVSISYARLFLRSLWWEAERQGVSLACVLRQVAEARLEETATGQILIGTSGNGASASFAPPGGTTLTTQALAELCSLLLDLYDDVVAELDNDPADADVYAAMLSRLVRVTRTVVNFGGIA